MKTDKFEGPMELLLELIEKEKMDVTELSMAKVADEYLEHIKDNEAIRLEHLAEFLSVASRLILIKSRSLLPMLKFSEEEEEEIKDLTLQLEEYKKFKEASEKLGKLSAAGRISYAREGFGGVREIFYPPEDFNIFDLKKYFEFILAEIPLIEKLQEEIVTEVVTLEERINELEMKIRAKVETSFSDLVANASDKVEIIISFLAMLEMIKQRVVAVEQGELFSEIRLSIMGR
ncbi:MAG: segregation and condensation protein [Patescibacteria group bacterium]|nr:segregation and condensation protein [Patescibacteria group bacterium]